MDAFTTILSLAAQYLLNRKTIENWLLWIVADVIYIWLYISRGLQLTAVLYFVFLCLCVAGFLNWRRSLKAQAGAAQTAADGNLSKECEHILVDRDREAVPISGTLVRSNPLGCWDFLEPPVRAWYAKRICLVGAESTGKTTLAQMLAERYQTVWVPEYGREYSERKLAEDGELIREWMHDTFVAELTAQQRPFRLVSGALQDRFDSVVEYIDELITGLGR